MLHLEKVRMEDTVRIKIRNRLFYILALDGLSLEESERLWLSLLEYMNSVVKTEDGPYPQNDWSVHYSWWERQKVAVLFITGDVLDRLQLIEKDPQELVETLIKFEENEIHIPYCSMNALEGKLETGKSSVASRVSITTNDNTGEVVVSTSEEICRAAFRR